MRYKAIAEQIIDDVKAGKLSVGTRMPSLRNLARLFNVSMTTALNSYHLLESLGWIIAKPQSGFYVTMPLLDRPTPHQPQFSSVLTEVDRQKPIRHFSNQSGPLGISQFDPREMPTTALQNSLRRGLKRLDGKIHAYPEPQGDQALRLALERHFSTYGFPFSANELIITNGCIDAVRIALESVTQPGDAIAISSPCFSGLLELLGSLGRKVVEIPCVREGIDLVQLEQHLSQGTVKAGLFSTSHMNPQGISLSPSQKQALAALANRYQVPIIEDDIYMELGYDKVMPLPAKYWDQGGYLLWCGSVSKTLTAGFRLGWCLAGRYQSTYLKRHAMSHFGVSTPIQAGLADFISSGQYYAHLQKTRLRIQQNIREYQMLLLAHLPEGSAVSQPTGGLVLWVQVPRLNSQKLWHDAAQQGVDIRCGAEFSTLPLYQDCFRINVGWSLNAQVDEAHQVQQQLVQLMALIPSCIGTDGC